jgi:hypothetical protein
MPWKSIQTTRAELYRLIWTEPMQQAAKRFHLSDVGLAKRCRRRNIPVPPRGYWARRQSGKKDKIPALPPSPYETVVFERWEDPHAGPPLAPELADLIAREGLPENRMVVSPETRPLHPIVKETKKALGEAKPDERGILRSFGSGFWTRVAKASVPRALGVLQALAAGCEARGLSFSTDRKGRPVIRVRGVELSFGVEERAHIVKDPAPAQIAAFKRRFPYTRMRIMTPSGVLHLHLLKGEWQRRTWTDGKRHKIEEFLNDVIVAAQTIAWEDERARIREERRKELLAVANRREESRAGRITELERVAAVHRHFNELAVFVDAAERRTPPDAPPALARWLRWAKLYVRHRDPVLLFITNRGKGSSLAEHDEVEDLDV